MTILTLPNWELNEPRLDQEFRIREAPPRHIHRSADQGRKETNSALLGRVPGKDGPRIALQYGTQQFHKQNKNSASGVCKGLQGRGSIDPDRDAGMQLAPRPPRCAQRWWQATEHSGEGVEFAVPDLAYLVSELGIISPSDAGSGEDDEGGACTNGAGSLENPRRRRQAGWGAMAMAMRG
ncbi:hypothetical protein SETIT_4G278000v2 [Setaria italica]|uniref:Uncharacterized protein n=1 Tax=Setaria italica TaxID=4555 RepID=A0A368QYZ9_SETIT|nr:hypothetical protein SETIT_4G278000v2 [Setaria italica]